MRLFELFEAKTDKKKVPATTPRNFVAKNAKTSGAGHHRDKKRDANLGKTKHKNKSNDLSEAATPGYIRYEQMKDKISGVLIKLHNQGKDEETIKQMGARIATHLGYSPDDEMFNDAFLSLFVDADLNGDFDKEDEDDYTDYSMRQGELGNPDRMR